MGQHLENGLTFLKWGKNLESLSKFKELVKMLKMGQHFENRA